MAEYSPHLCSVHLRYNLTFTYLMRLFRALPILSLLFGARASSFDSRAPTAHPHDARDLLDVCSSVDTELVVPDLLGILTAVGVIGQFNFPLSQPFQGYLLE